MSAYWCAFAPQSVRHCSIMSERSRRVALKRLMGTCGGAKDTTKKGFFLSCSTSLTPRYLTSWGDEDHVSRHIG